LRFRNGTEAEADEEAEAERDEEAELEDENEDRPSLGATAGR
jgi:hypothetical protein